MEDFELQAAAVPSEIRDELVRRVLVLLEGFNDEHDLTLDLPGRLELLDVAMDEWVDAITSNGQPVH